MIYYVEDHARAHAFHSISATQREWWDMCLVELAAWIADNPARADYAKIAQRLRALLRSALSDETTLALYDAQRAELTLPPDPRVREVLERAIG
ncbi:hypothetical protein [Paraburkholderia mimosarum]|uniref:hypothetical protein n=1 Tax=Paraburkholderia mimosarum TaxID=312026 RepID=UPI00041F6316|nr:hypothetical protein [Paraburkholderia mimosarum]